MKFKIIRDYNPTKYEIEKMCEDNYKENKDFIDYVIKQLAKM